MQDLTLAERVRFILLHEWDPLGIADEPEAQGEYDDYVAEIRALVISLEPRQRFIDHLDRIETDLMSLGGDRQRAGRVADRLIGLRK